MFTRDLALLMDDFWAPRWSVQRTAEKAEPRERRIEPTVVVAKEDDCTYVEMLVPGFSPESIKIKTSGNVLEIAGERNSTRRKELHGVFKKSIELTPEIDVDAIKANCENGVLTVCLPKVKEKVREIKIL